MRYTALLLALLTAACEPFVHAAGTVRDSTGAPVAGAVVTLQLGDDPRVESAHTDSAGRFALTRFGNLEAPIRVRVCREGYAPEQREFGSAAAVPESMGFVLRARADPARPPVGGQPC